MWGGGGLSGASRQEPGQPRPGAGWRGRKAPCGGEGGLERSDGKNWKPQGRGIKICIYITKTERYSTVPPGKQVGE